MLRRVAGGSPCCGRVRGGGAADGGEGGGGGGGGRRVAPLFPLPVFGWSLWLHYGGGARVVWTALRGIKEVLRGVTGHHSGVAFMVALEKVYLSQVSPAGSLPLLVGAGWAVFVQ